MATEGTAVILSAWSAAMPTRLEGSVSTEPQPSASSTIGAGVGVEGTPISGTGTASKPGGASDLGHGTTTVEARAAILDSLYAERRLLTRAARDGDLSEFDRQSLIEIERYIDYWELQGPEAATEERVWRKLEELSQSMLTLRASQQRP
jgi:hypothetical protein